MNPPCGLDNNPWTKGLVADVVLGVAPAALLVGNHNTADVRKTTITNEPTVRQLLGALLIAPPYLDDTTS
jgi:hypothetical protein